MIHHFMINVHRLNTHTLRFEVRPPRDVLGLGAILNGTGTGGLGQLFRKVSTINLKIYIQLRYLNLNKKHSNGLVIKFLKYSN